MLLIARHSGESAGVSPCLSLGLSSRQEHSRRHEHGGEITVRIVRGSAFVLPLASGGSYTATQLLVPRRLSSFLFVTRDPPLLPSAR